MTGVIPKPKLYAGQKWTCERCRLVFNSTKLWQRHKAQTDCEFKPAEVKRPKNPKPLKLKTWICKVCTKTFNTEKKLRDHRKSEHRTPEDIPEIHTYKFDELQDIYICCTCSAEFQEEAEVEVHIKTHEELHKCDSCDEKFKSIFDLGVHSLVHNETHVSCSQCSYTSANVHSFKSHVNRMHLHRYPHVCGTCGRAFTGIKSFEEHKVEHAGEKPHVCIVCGKKFAYKRYLNVHQVRNHQVGTSGKRVENECARCHRFFYKAEDLESHYDKCWKNKEQPKKQFLCPTCGKSYTTNANLIKHINTHTGDLPYKCGFCDRSFVGRDRMKCHERVHTGEKPYSCEFCGKRFAHHSPFRVHRRTHTGEKPYVCQFCNKGHTTNQGLRLHVKGCREKGFSGEHFMSGF